MIPTYILQGKNGELNHVGHGVSNWDFCDMSYPHANDFFLKYPQEYKHID
jgi:hypothetical protein